MLDAHRSRRGFSTLSLLALFIASPLAAQDDPVGRGAEGSEAGASAADVVEIAPTTSAIRIDGVVDEPVWNTLPPFPLTMYAPTFGGELTEDTEIRMTYDDRYLYVSARMFDSEPAQIRTNTFYRDRYSGDDLIAVIIDSYNDYETGVWFVANPSGARQDRSLSNDGEFTGGTMPMNWDWNSHWDVATTQDERGWFAEFRIPFSTLGFQALDGDVTMGLILYRHIPRKNERQVFPAMNPEWGGMGFAKPSRAQRIRLRGVEPTTPVYVTPYVLGGMAQVPELREAPGPAWRTETDPTTELGADLKYSPTSNLALDVTVNTDFAQVEADQQQVNLTRFALFFPEKRQFFQERSSTFDFNTGGFFNRLFHSRQIGLNEGQIVRLYGGVRAVGRLGDTDFGVLTMQTASQGDRSSENMGVLRLSHQVLNPYSSVGGMLTTRIGSHEQDNVAYGLDSQLRLIGDEYFVVRWAQTFDQAVDEASVLESGLFQARWERRRQGGLSYYAEYRRVGADYLPRLGFQLRDDYGFGAAQVQHKSFRDATSPFTSFGAAIHTEHFYRNSDGTPESRSITPQLLAELKNGTEITLSAISSFESVRDSFDIADVVVAPGEFWFHQGQLHLVLARSGIFRGEFTAAAGTFFDGTRVGLALNPAWNVSRYLELGAGYELNRLEFGDRSQSTSVHLGRLNVQIALDTHLSLNSFFQYSGEADLTSMNVRFRYHFREGTDLWVVYNEGLNTARSNGIDPRLPLSAGRTLMVKYTHAFIW